MTGVDIAEEEENEEQNEDEENEEEEERRTISVAETSFVAEAKGIQQLDKVQAGLSFRNFAPGTPQDFEEVSLIGKLRYKHLQH